MSSLQSSILVVEDEPQMRRFLRASLGSRGYRVLEAESVLIGLQMVTSHSPDLVLMDLGLPDGDGISLTKRIREWTQVPIIVISARGREADKVVALDAGADDYLTKPFGVDELLARIRVALRHASGQRSAYPEEQIHLGELSLDLARREVRARGENVRLTPIEYKLLVLLARHAGRVLTHRQILKEVWGPSYEAQPHYVRVHMAELRKKIEQNPARPRIVVTEPGVGYRLQTECP